MIKSVAEIPKYAYLAVIFRNGEEFHFSIEDTIANARRVKDEYETRKGVGMNKYHVDVYEVVKKVL